MASNDGWEDVSHELDQSGDGWEDVSHELEKTSAFDAFHKNASDTALLGYGPQVRAGGIDPIVEKVGNFITGQDVDMGDYLSNRDAYRKEINKTKDEHPAASMAGSLTGGIATSLIPGLNAAKGVTAGARILNAAKAGAVMGGAMNPGDTEGEISGPQIGDRIMNAGKGLAIGAAAQGAGEGIAKGLSSGSKYFKDLAEEKAVKAAGARKGDMQKLRESGKLNDLGRTLLDDEIVTPLARPKDIADRVSSKINNDMQTLKVTMKNADDVFNTPGGLNMENATTAQIEAFNRGQISTNSIKDSLMKDMKDSFAGVPEEELAPALNKIETWFKNRPEYMSVDELQQLKTSLNKFLKSSDYYKDMPGMAKEGLLSVRRGAKEAIENKTNAAAEILGEAGGKVKDTNRHLGKMLEVDDMVSDAMGRDAANRSFGLTDTIAGGAGAGIGSAAGGVVGGGIPGMIVGAGANKLGRMYGNSLMATGFDKVSKILMQSPRFAEMAKTNPKAFASMVTAMSNNPKLQQSMMPQKTPHNLMDRLSQDPSQIDMLKNDKLKEEIKKQRDANKFKEHVPVGNAQKDFINGN